MAVTRNMGRQPSILVLHEARLLAMVDHHLSDGWRNVVCEGAKEEQGEKAMDERVHRCCD